MKRTGRLFRKYAFVLALLVGGTLLSSSLLELYFSFEENRSALVAVQVEKTAGAAARIEQFLTEIDRQLDWVVQPAFAVGAVNLEERRADYLRLLRLVPAIAEVAYLDATGREQLRVRRNAADVLGSQLDFSSDQIFLEARSHSTYFSPVTFERGTDPTLVMAKPEPGEAAGVTAATVRLRLIYDVVVGIRVGVAGQAYVVDADGQLIAHPDIELVLRRTNLSGAPQVQQGRVGDSLLAQDLGGRPVLAAVQQIDGPAWLVVVEQPLEEAFAPLYASLVRTGAFLLAGLGLSLMASLVLARRMARPIQALETGAARIGTGQLDQRIHVDSDDELETLADQFNAMAAQLRESYADLEDKVEQRTRALAGALNEIEHQSRQLAVVSQHKSAFLANMSHELRTPLNAILGYTDLILDGIYGHVPGSVRDVLDRVERSGKHLLSLIDDVLDLSKIEAGQLTLSFSAFAPGDVVRTVCATLEPLAKEKGLQLIPEVALDLPLVRGDERRITQVLLNLAGNAIKFTESGEVRLSARASDTGIRLAVADTGPGLSPHEHERIFDAFQQADGPSTHKSGGTGLGLAIARHIVELHGGQIWVESAPGHGASFFVTLPTRVERMAVLA